MAKGWSFDGLIKALKSAAFLDVGVIADTVAAGNDQRIVNAVSRTGDTMTGPLSLRNNIPVSGQKSNGTDVATIARVANDNFLHVGDSSTGLQVDSARTIFNIGGYASSQLDAGVLISCTATSGFQGALIKTPTGGRPLLMGSVDNLQNWWIGADAGGAGARFSGSTASNNHVLLAADGSVKVSPAPNKNAEVVGKLLINSPSEDGLVINSPAGKTSNYIRFKVNNINAGYVGQGSNLNTDFLVRSDVNGSQISLETSGHISITPKSGFNVYIGNAPLAGVGGGSMKWESNTNLGITSANVISSGNIVATGVLRTGGVSGAQLGTDGNIAGTIWGSVGLKAYLDNAVGAKLNSNANAVSATKLATARTINGVSFDGTANINLPNSVVATGSGDGFYWRQYSDGTKELFGSVEVMINRNQVINIPTPFSSIISLNANQGGRYGGANAYWMRYFMTNPADLSKFTVYWDTVSTQGQGSGNLDTCNYHIFGRA